MKDVPCSILIKEPNSIPVIPCGMVPPVKIYLEEKPPYHYDPSDDDLGSPGCAVANLLSVPELSTTSEADKFLSYMTHRELTGYEEYD